MNTNNDNKSKQAGAADNKNTPKVSETKSKPNAQSGKEASGEKNESAPAGKQTFVNLPKGGGAISGMGEKFQANPITGTGSLSVPLTISSGRGEFTPQLALAYDSGSGNGLFGLGWSVGIPSISRKTDKGLPEYLDLENHESDTFILSGAEDLVPILKEENSQWVHDTRTEVVGTTSYKVFPYQPRTEGLFAVVERWYDTQEGISHWRSISKENISSVYGLNSTTRIANHAHPKQIFTWLIEKSWDAKGNLIEFEYKQEDATQVPRTVYESQRLQTSECFTNQYLKQVKYGNLEMYTPIYPAIPEYTHDWHFHLVFDYGDHLTNNTQITTNQDWACRQDPFSTYKAGFEIRTYRLCQRVLMFHQFDELGENPVLVKSTEFSYEEHPHLTILRSVTHCGHDGTETETLPSLEFTYSQAELGTKMHEVKPEYLDNIPSGVDGQTCQWADLYSEGINGILKQDNKAWYFIPNQGDKSYYDTNPDSRAELVLGGIRCELLKPAAMNTRQSSYHLADVDSDGLPELVINAPGMKGFYARDEKSQWQAFRPFSEMPNLNLGDSSVKIVDLSGEGMGDILIGKGDYFEIYLSEGKKGYGNFRRIRCNTTEAKGPRAIFSDELKQIYLADMSGDGLSDIVRILNGSVCYWPNIGYGRFGERVMMANPPHYERPDQFNPSQIRLSDVDGTGTTDIIYFGSTAAKYWKNQAGNSWSDALEIKNFPLVDPMSNAEVVDLFGNGTSCLVWSSKRPSQSRKMRYLELTNGIKPYLMIQTDNGMGGITKLQYTTSTKFYLRDKMSGKPWITRLPFPVHVLESVENRDEVSGSVFVNRYAYHHGYYDNDEREFRGFGMVEQWDTEVFGEIEEIEGIGEIGEGLNGLVEIVPPVYVKTWFHTGFFKNRIEISKQFADEYFDGDAQAWLLPDTVLPSGLSAIEAREACRALRGSALRKEVYAQDGTSQELIPYTVEEKNYDIRKLQGIHSNKHGVFHITERETLAYQYECNTDDPRILQSLVLDTDEYGNVKKSAQVAYPRRANSEALAEQLQMHIVYTENSFINKSEIGEIHLIGVGCETKAFEVTGISNNNEKFGKDNLLTAIANATEINYTATLGTTPEKRKIQHQRIYFWNETLTQVLPLEEITPQALPYQQQNLELTQDIIDEFNSESTKLTTTMLQNEGKYLQDGNNWWIVSEKQIFDASSFYLPVSVIDPFGNESSLMYDEYHLMIEQITDALQFETDVFNDYRVMQAWKITDPNGNSQSVAFDALGMVKALAVSGKNSGEGDSLNDPTIKYEYDLHNWRNNQKPVYSHVESRETHGDPNSRWLESYTYSGGLGQEVQTKVQAEDGLAWTIVDGTPVQVESTDRWTSTGRTILNNKGKAVKQYEPWFSTTPDYEPESELTEYGVTPILHYDPLSRNIKTDFPDGTFTKVEFTPWEQKSYDQNDNVLASQWYADRSPSSSASTEDKRAAQITLEHNNTPQTVYFDSLGRAFITEDDNGTFGKYRVKNKLDISGRPLEVTDAKERIMTWHFYGFTQALTTRNIDSGKRWTINDVAGKPIRAWDERGHVFRNTYDVLQRPLEMFVTENSIEKLVQKQEYGISAVLNNIGQIHKIYDQSGVTIITQYDFKGNPLASAKSFCIDYQNDIDWSQNTDVQTEIFTQSTEYDALNRPVLLTQADGSIIQYTYNKGALLETVEVQHRGVGNYQTYISDVNYNEKGQRTDIYYGNNSKTKYEYDDKSFRVKRILTTRNTGIDILQNIYYFYDPIGNITEMRDDAQQINYFDNAVIAPTGKYEYDPLYRLLKAEGRELSSLNAPDYGDFANNIPVPNPSANAMQNYTQLFVYDELGNIQSMSSQDIAEQEALKHINKVD